MTWEAGTFYAAACDRCHFELEDPDTGGIVLFAADEKARLNEYWAWQTVNREDGTVEMICVDCLEEIGADDPLLDRLAAERARFDQTGPDLLGSES